MISKSLGNYQLVEPLVENDDLSSFKAWDALQHRDVVIKIVCYSCAGDSEFLKQFQQQARLLSRLSHPHIINILDHSEQEGVPYLVMDYLPGGSLKQHLTGKPLPWLDAIKLLIPIAQALAYAHQQGVVHGSVNPAVVISRDGEALVGETLNLDFGIKSLLGIRHNSDASSTNLETETYAARYLAPEQVQGGDVDFHADIYALGLICYELISGHSPFIGETLTVVLHNKINQPIPPLAQYIPDLPGAVDSVLMKALAKNPEERFTGMDAFAQALVNLTEVKITSGLNGNIPASPSEEMAAIPAGVEANPSYGGAESHKVSPEPSPTSTIQNGRSHKGAWIIGAVMAVLVLVAGVILYLKFTNQLGNTPILNIKITIPRTLRVGDKFDLIVKIKNTGKQSITISEIGLPNVLLDGVTMEGANPPSIDQRGYIDYTNYRFDLAVKPGQITVIVFDMVAKKEGLYRGQIPVYERLNSIFTKIQTQINK